MADEVKPLVGALSDIADDFDEGGHYWKANRVREAVECLSRPSNPDAMKLAERLGPYSVQLRLTEDYSGEHREWAQEYTIPQGHPLIGEIAADVAALSRQPYPAPDVERLKDLVRRFGKCFSCKDGIASAVINDEPRNYTCLVCGGDGLHPDARAILKNTDHAG